MPQIAIQVGIMAGSMALQYIFAPKVKNPPVDKGKFDDIRITGSDYGAFIPRIWGKVRLGGNVVVSTGIDHYIIETPSSGGKGGVPQAPATRTHVYKTSVAVLVSRRVTNFLRVWADTDILAGVNGGGVNTQQFYEAEDAFLAGGAAIFPDVEASEGLAVTNLGNGGTITFSPAGALPAVPVEPVEPIDTTRIAVFYKCATNLNVEVKTNSDLGLTTQTVLFHSTDGAWSVRTVLVRGHVNSIELGNPSSAIPDIDKIGVYFSYLNLARPDSTYRMSSAVNPFIGYPTDLDDPSEYYNFQPVKDDATGETMMTTPIPGEEIRYYTGTETQTQDSRIISWLDSRWGTGVGISRTSAMRGCSVFVLQDTTLKQGHLPNYTVEQEYIFSDVNDILEELFNDVGIEDYDLSNTAGLTQVGFLEHTATTRKALIEHLQRYHQFRLAEVDGKLITVLDNGPTVGTISADDLRAHNDGEEMPAFDAEVLLKEESLMPREVRVSGMIPELEYHNEAVTAQFFAGIKSTESKEYTFPIVDSKDRLRQVAEVLLRKEHAESKAFEFWGMPSIAKWAIGDVIPLPLNGLTYEIRIEKKVMTLPIGKIRFQAVLRDPIAFITVNEIPPIANMAPNIRENMLSTVPFPRNTVIFVIPSLPILERDHGKLGVYLAISGRGRGYHENAALYREIGDENYVLQSVIDSSSPLGLCAEVLADWENSKGDEDTDNTLDIWFFDEIELETVTSDDIARYPTVNLLRVGNEWLQFRTAEAQTLEDDSPYRSKWRVSNFMRGRFLTDDAMVGHGTDEYAALVTPALRFFELEKEDIGEVINLKAVTGGQALEVAPIASFEFDGAIGRWEIGNYTEDRTINAESYTFDELGDVLGTLVKKDLNL